MTMTESQNNAEWKTLRLRKPLIKMPSEMEAASHNDGVGDQSTILVRSEILLHLIPPFTLTFSSHLSESIFSELSTEVMSTK